MFKLLPSLCLVFLMFSHVVHANVPPTVTLDNATVAGVPSGPTNHFLGIRYAQSPTGNLRFRLPQPLPPYNTDFSALKYPPACPQQQAVQLTSLDHSLPAETVDYLTTLFGNAVLSAEDCLMLNVIAPANATPASKLPVVVWFIPGAFQLDGAVLHDGAIIVERGVMLNTPVVYVGVGYRQSAFGFLASQEVKDAGVGNLGLQDQRLALRWVQKYIGAFGGDPNKVTLWGYSSSAITIALQMLTNGGNPEGLFRAAIMQGGAALPFGDITHGQPDYDALVAETGCSRANDTLQCLREAPYNVLLKAVSQSPGIFTSGSLDLAWLPRVDGVFLTANPLSLIEQGIIADVPFVSGSCDDEGTLFTLLNVNITTDAQVADYMKTYYLRNASSDTIEQLMKYYPSNPSEGSPFGTGYFNALTPEFKRIAAIKGDAMFQAPRRFLLQNQAGKQNIWTYLSKRLKATPFLGSFHASDIFGAYGLSDMASYFIRFIANLDPNMGESMDLYWPQYDATNQAMLQLLDGVVPQTLTTDTYRAEEMNFLTKVLMDNPL